MVYSSIKSHKKIAHWIGNFEVSSWRYQHVDKRHGHLSEHLKPATIKRPTRLSPGVVIEKLIAVVRHSAKYPMYPYYKTRANYLIISVIHFVKCRS